MQRFTVLLISLTIVGSSAFAGQIQIGGPNGLTQSVINNSSSSVGERGFDPRLFLAVTPSPTPYTGYSTSTANAGTFTDSTNGVIFSAINDGVAGSGYSNNFWDLRLGSGAGASVTIPIDTYDVTSVYTMLNELWGSAGNQDAQVTFNFSGSSPLTLQLTASTGTVAGQIRNAVNCSSGCDSSAVGALAPTSTVNGIQVVTGTVFSSPYTGTAGAAYDMGTTGEVYLDDQGFDFTGTAYSSPDIELTSIVVTNLSATDDLGLTAVTVNAAPEPSTILLGFAGIALIGAARLRRRANRHN